MFSSTSCASSSAFMIVAGSFQGTRTNGIVFVVEIAGEDTRVDAYICKSNADEMAFRVVDRCMQIFGGMGLTTDLPIEKFWRQQRSYRITEGASEVMKMVIARHVLKAYP